jgi:hypothetical protein
MRGGCEEGEESKVERKVEERKYRNEEERKRVGLTLTLLSFRLAEVVCKQESGGQREEFLLDS